MTSSTRDESIYLLHRQTRYTGIREQHDKIAFLHHTVDLLIEIFPKQSQYNLLNEFENEDENRFVILSVY